MHREITVEWTAKWRGTRQVIEIKGIKIAKEEEKLTSFADDMIRHTENPKDSIRKLLELINEFS